MMKGFILSVRSEFYKSRKTLGFWCSILLPLLICLLIFMGFLTHSEKASGLPGQFLWMMYANSILNIMGLLLLPIYVIFVAYSVNSIEHKADTWKTLFSLPISKWSVYSAKYFFALFLVFLCLLLFFLFTIASGNLLNTLKPELKFNEFHMESFLGQVYFKLFLSSLGILSIQFLLSLVWSDFLKPMGIGFIGTISAIIMVTTGWQYGYLVPYAHPLLAIKGLLQRQGPGQPVLSVDLFTQEIYVSLAVALVFFIAGFFIVQKKSVK
ncbi:ABC transporter permease [Mucilaginibacter paludis]|uniref:ABC transporter permease n=1 Tax=Mucilaginibacter paludis DSM 18603 TaxID=714943 RepID=H1YFE6_9SPHI|nr:ABC transporter permease [Mucilaginibacter paludis]EHQ27254.1 hypothetical protein Mucpa_3150 [Mucilaginibacter paludis DSM 18603]